MHREVPMPRKPRFNLADVPLHVIQRGNNRSACFFADKDYQFYFQCLKESAKKFGVDVHAYVLMTNHVHLLLTPHAPGAVSRFMQAVGRRYVQYINFQYQRSGTLWEGRYKASLVDTDPYLLTCYRYIELNPVRANMVSHPGDYRWSSYRHNGQGNIDPQIIAHPLYNALGDSQGERCDSYRRLFHAQMDTHMLDEIREALNQELVLGCERFKEEIEKHLGRRTRPAKRGRPQKKNDELQIRRQKDLF